MKIHLYGKEEDLPCDLWPVLEKAEKLAIEHNVVVPRFKLQEPHYKNVGTVFEGVSSRLIKYQLFQEFSDIHALVFGKKTPPQDSEFLKGVKGTTASGGLIGLFLENPESQEAIEEVVLLAFPHELYHAMRMQSEAFEMPKSIGSTMVEEGLAEVFAVQKAASLKSELAKKKVTSQLSHLDKHCIDIAYTHWQRLDAVDFDLKKLTFNDGAETPFHFYDFSFALVAATLEKKGWSVMDHDILFAPHNKILDLWRPERGGNLDLKCLPEMVSSESFKKYLLSPQP